MNAKDFLEEKGYSFQGRMSVKAKPSIIAKIMDEYAREQVKNCSIPVVVGRSEQFYCEMSDKTECRQTGVQCPECKSFQQTWE